MKQEVQTENCWEKTQPITVGEEGNKGETGEDTFFGVIHSEGISKIKLVSGDASCNAAQPKFMEVDHLQYGKIESIIPDCPEGTQLKDRECKPFITPNPEKPISDSQLFPLVRNYQDLDDSPLLKLSQDSEYFYFEDFEDGVLNLPGLSLTNGNVGENSGVDADDGKINENSYGGKNYYFSENSIIFDFDKSVTPNYFGVVLTEFLL